MQSNCQKLKLPFEVLIQGPSGNQFVRKLVTEAETSMPMQDLTLIRRARSTVSIYQPDEKKSDVDGGTSVLASEGTNQAVIPVVTESKHKQSMVASLSKQMTTTAATPEKPNTEKKESTTAATAPEKKFTEPTTATPNKGTEKTEPLRQKRQDEAAASVNAPVAAPAEKEETPAAKVAAPDAKDATENGSVAKAAGDVTEKPDDGPDVGGPRVGLPLLPLFPFGPLPVLGSPAIGLAAIKAETVKNIALIKAGVAKNLAAAKIGAPLAVIGGPLAAAKAAAGIQLAAIKAKLPILPAII